MVEKNPFYLFLMNPKIGSKISLGTVLLLYHLNAQEVPSSVQCTTFLMQLTSSIECPDLPSPLSAMGSCCCSHTGCLLLLLHVSSPLPGMSLPTRHRPWRATPHLLQVLTQPPLDETSSNSCLQMQPSADNPYPLLNIFPVSLITF